MLTRWEFISTGGDIGFRVYYHRDGHQENDILDLVSSDRIQAHLITEEGQIICDTAGKCTTHFFIFVNWIVKLISIIFLLDVVEFDNSFSYFNSKKVHYLITVDSPSNWNKVQHCKELNILLVYK